MFVGLLLAGAATLVTPADRQSPRLDTAPVSRNLTAGQMFALADAATARGNIALAETIYRAMLADSSRDIRLEARYRLAKLESARGNLSRAAVLLREILDERPDTPSVRLELARILDRMGDSDGALRQLRAAQAGGLPPAVARLVDRYSEALRAQRPFGATIEVGLAPDSNINRATRSDTLGTVFGDFDISKQGRAKSGVGVALYGQTYRRLPLSPKASLLVRLTSSADLYPESRFNDVSADLAAGPEIASGSDRLQFEVGATQRWFGQKPFVRLARTSATLSHQLGRRSLLRLSGTAALVDNQMNDLQDGKSYSVQADLERAMSATTGVAGTVGFDRQSLNDAGYSTSNWRAGLTGWRDFGRLTITAGADVARLHADDRLLLFPRRREDRYWRFSAAATFRHLQFRGLAPVVRFSVERNRSSIELYDYRRTRTEIGIVRAF